MTIVEMCVHMDCAGCESKIRKSLRKLQGVDAVDIDMARQKVTVTGSVDQKKVLKAVRKTGRRAVLWTYPFVDGEHHMYGGSSSTDQHYNYGGHPALAQHHMSGSFRGNASSYNYYKHGYVHGPAHSAAMGERAGDVFSDENTNACSVM